MVMGVEGAGVVRRLGPGVSGFAPGDRVAWISGPGSYADQVVVDAARAVPIPAGLTDEVAAACLLQGIAAHYLSTSCYRVRSGETVLVHAIAGGVGRLLAQMVALRGAKVIGTASTEAKRDKARAAGTEHVVGYRGLERIVQDITKGRGVTAVFDGVGASTFQMSLACLRVHGVMVLYGSSSGAVPSVAVSDLSGRGLYLTRPSIRHYTRTRGELLRRANEVFTLLLIPAPNSELVGEVGRRGPE